MEQSIGGASDPRMQTQLVSAASTSSTTTAAPQPQKGGFCVDDESADLNLKMCIIIGSSVGGGLFVIIAAIAVYRRRKKKTISLNRFIEGTEEDEENNNNNIAANSTSPSPRGVGGRMRNGNAVHSFHDGGDNGENNESALNIGNRTFVPNVNEVDMYFADDIVIDDEEMLDIQPNDVHDADDGGDDDDVDLSAFDEMYRSEANSHLDAFGADDPETRKSSSSSSSKHKTKTKNKKASVGQHDRGAAASSGVTEDEIIDIL